MDLETRFKLGIVAPSSQVPRHELSLGLERLRRLGFSPVVHPQCAQSHLFFAGTDKSRAQAFWDYALKPEFSVLWSARGGYGACRILPFLEKLEKQKKSCPPKKLLIGYSDSTALMEYVRSRWSWSILHAPMPSLKTFSLLPEKDLKKLRAWILGERQGFSASLKPLTTPLKTPSKKLSQRHLRGSLLGGNLTVWTSLLGTPYAGGSNSLNSSDYFLFLEDLEESPYRIDRMLQQLALSSALTQVKTIILGEFLNCTDSPARVLRQKPQTLEELKQWLHSPGQENWKPLRRTYTQGQALKQIFSELGSQQKIPIMGTLPVGHGPHFSPLPLGGCYELSSQGRLELLDWEGFLG